MKWLNKLFEIGALMTGCLALAPKNVKACSSAKPMGRGETSVAVADDASAVYWNPAGLVQLERPELDVTAGIGLNYKAFLCYGQPLGEKSALGLNLSHRVNYNPGGYELRTDWLKLGYSRKLTENLSTGANLTFRRNYLDGRLLTHEEQPSYPVHIDGTVLTADLGFLYKYGNKIKLGLLLQGLENVRPGVSFKLDDKTLLVLEWYDITKEYKRLDGRPWRHYRSGLDRKMNDKLSLRAGCGINDYGEFEHVTAGASYKKGKLEASVAFMHWKSGGNSVILTVNKKL